MNSGIMHDGGADTILAPMFNTTRRYYLVMAFFAALVGAGVVAYTLQFFIGLGTTGMGRPMFWAIYMVNFVFFIGISHAGTLISAILRVSGAEWRRPVTRVAEAITVFALCIGAPQVLIDMGRADRLVNPFLVGRFESPILWDICCITTYLSGSVSYLFLPLVPDLALVRDRMPAGKPFWKLFYTVLAMGWRGTPRQIAVLDRAVAFMAIIIIPIAVSVHTVVSFVFSMTVQPMWHSTILGPYFVIGAIFSGIATLLIAMAILRKAFHLERYFDEKLFDNLGKLLVVMTVLWGYATLAEYLTTFYGSEPSHMAVFDAKVSGPFAAPFWLMIVTCLAIPLPILANPRTRTIAGCVVASISINIGMWLERYMIIVPTLSNPRLPAEVPVYLPSITELTLTVASFAMLVLLFGLFIKFFPIVSVWEIHEGEEIAAHDRQEIIAQHLAATAGAPTSEDAPELPVAVAEAPAPSMAS